MKIRSCKISIITERPISAQASSLRGFIAGCRPEIALLHNHVEGNSLIYTFPRVLYHIIDGYPVIIGIDEGVDAAKQAAFPLREIMLNRISYRILGTKENDEEVEFGMADTASSYSFLTPWLALNQKNYETYQMLGSWAKRKPFLENIFVGNLISMSKCFGYTVPAPIEVRLGRMKEVAPRLKGTPMLGFLGDFSVNFEIPDYWGIGKSVSRGFGTVKRKTSSKISFRTDE